MAEPKDSSFKPGTQTEVELRDAAGHYNKFSDYIIRSKHVLLSSSGVEQFKMGIELKELEVSTGLWWRPEPDVIAYVDANSDISFFYLDVKDLPLKLLRPGAMPPSIEYNRLGEEMSDANSLFHQASEEPELGLVRNLQRLYKVVIE